MIEKAITARENAVAPYSSFMAGAAIETKDGRTYTGCNVESASYGLTICANGRTRALQGPSGTVP